jgi:hypothetical protein
MEAPVLNSSNLDLLSELTPSKNVPLVAVPWSKFGSRRLYVHTADGHLVGWVDLKTGHRALVQTELALAFELALSEAEVARIADLTQSRRAQQLEVCAGDDQADEQPTPMRHAYRGKRAYSTWELGPCGNRLVADEPRQPVVVDPHWAYLNSASAR